MTYNEYLMAKKISEVTEKNLEELIKKIWETWKNIILEEDDDIKNITKEEDKFLYELCDSIQGKICVADIDINKICTENLQKKYNKKNKKRPH